MSIKKLSALVSVLLAMSLFVSACALPAGRPAHSQDAALKITGLPKGDISAGLDDIKALKVYEGRAEGSDSEGTPVVFDIKGAYFSDLLEKNGYSQDALAGIRITALDGYSIEVPRDILSVRDVIIAYEMDGKPLDSDNAPFRVFIPGERAMYWVRMVSGIDVIETEQPDEVSAVYIMESIYGKETWEDYRFVSENYKVLNTKKILEEHPSAKGGIVLMTAFDGLKKNETVENFCKGAINMTGENSPEFFSNTLPEGMFIKKLVMFKYGGNAFYFAGVSGSVTLQGLLQYCGMHRADAYVLSFLDGSKKSISGGDLPLWTLDISDGIINVGTQGAQALPGLISISKK